MARVQWGLYPFQQEAVDKVIATVSGGKRSPIVVIPTGGGKTQTYLALTQQMRDAGMVDRVMILAHRKGLVEEPVQRLTSFFPEMSMDVGMVMANWNQPSKKIIAASRDTVNKEARIREILKWGKIDLLITDECHNADNKSSEFIRESLYAVNPNMIHVGFTATPRERQGHIWDSDPVDIKLAWMIKNRYLVEPAWFPVQVGIKLDSVSSSTNSYGQKDFSAKPLAEILETQNWCELIVNTHLKCADRSGPSMAFTVSVAGSKRLAEAFNEAGVKAMHIDGEYSTQMRRDVMKALLSGDCEVVCNCAIWTEGTDIPPIRNLHMARPTYSDILYAQMMGRGLRTFNGKSRCMIFEYSDFSYNAGDPSWIGKVLGLPVSRQAVVKDVDGNLTGMVFTGDEGAKYLSGDPAEIITTQIDRLGRSPWKWIGEGNDWLMLPIGRWDRDQIERTYLVPPPSSDETALYAYVKKADNAWFIREVDGTRGLGYDQILEIAEGRAAEYGDPTLAQKKQEWRKLPVTEGQMKYGFVQESMSRGEASERITQRIMKDALKKKGFSVN